MNQTETALKDTNRRLRSVQRELVPLTTGLILSVKRNRVKRLQTDVRMRRKAAIKIQVSHYFDSSLMYAWNDAFPYYNYVMLSSLNLNSIRHDGEERLFVRHTTIPYEATGWNAMMKNKVKTCTISTRGPSRRAGRSRWPSSCLGNVMSSAECHPICASSLLFMCVLQSYLTIHLRYLNVSMKFESDVIRCTTLYMMHCNIRHVLSIGYSVDNIMWAELLLLYFVCF